MWVPVSFTFFVLMFQISYSFIEDRHPHIVIKKGIKERSKIRSSMITTVVINFVSSLLWVPVYHTVRTTYPPPETTPLGFLVRVPLIVVLSDVVFYLLHITFHKIPALYRYHHIHHMYVHPHAITALQCHWLEMVLVNVPYFMIPLLVAKVSYQYTVFYCFIAMASTVYSHSGLNFGVGSTFHHIHHLKRNGNYGDGLFMDKLFKTEIVD